MIGDASYQKYDVSSAAYYLGPNPDDTSDDLRMIITFRDDDSNGAFDFYDHPYDSNIGSIVSC